MRDPKCVYMPYQGYMMSSECVELPHTVNPEQVCILKKDRRHDLLQGFEKILADQLVLRDAVPKNPPSGPEGTGLCS